MTGVTLHQACELGRAGAAKLLLEAGADLTLRNTLGATPLLLAIGGRRHEVVDLLLERGADANDRDGFGVPALTRAFEAESLDLARRLLDAGASAAPRCKIQHRPLLALIEMFPKAENEAGSDGEEDDEEAEPFDAERALAMVWELLVRGAKVDDRNLLSSAVIADEPELIRLLVDAGTDWRQPDETGESLIDLAVSAGALRVFDLLLEWGAEPPAAGAGEGEGEPADTRPVAERTGAIGNESGNSWDFDEDAWDDEEEDECDDEDQLDEMLDSRFEEPF